MRAVNPWASYRQVATQTASSGQLVLMLFDGVIRFLERATSGFGLDDPAEANQLISNNVLRAQAIIHELNVSLNMEEGGEFADTLRQLYLYFDRRLQHSNLTKTMDGITEVIGRLTVLRDAWAQMLLQNQAQTAPDRAAELLAA
ncbi:MAG TPA: flagellar export chaperone FliS [Candidatus Limnocylindria bacterium]|jgi:flagellar protein FliS|nr:flagellar export chaperone FliS [Candidatus Limnocylindria bacterium]